MTARLQLQDNEKMSGHEIHTSIVVLNPETTN
jgi:hypothetical protein